MDRYDLFDKIFTEKTFNVEYGGNFCKRVVKSGEIDFIDEDSDTVMLTVTPKQVLCTECGVELTPDDCDMINERTLQITCPECFYKYRVTFPFVKLVKTSDKIKSSILEGCIYLADVKNEKKHVIYRDNKFLSIEDNEAEVKPDLLIEEVYLTNSEIADLRPPESINKNM